MADEFVNALKTSEETAIIEDIKKKIEDGEIQVKSTR